MADGTAADRVPPSPTDSARGVRGPERALAGKSGVRGPRRPTLRERGRRFVHRYGWRAYALPILALVTVAVLVGILAAHDLTGGAPAKHTAAAPPTAPAHIPLKSDSAAASDNDKALSSAALPAGVPYTEQGAGTFTTLPGTTGVVGSGKLFRYTIDVENGITGIDLTQFQDVITTTLADPRSWPAHGIAVQRVDSGPVDFRFTLTSALTVRTLCGYDQPIETSCYVTKGAVAAADADRVVLNNARWVRGDMNYIGDLAAYRIYLVNHEGGHALGHDHAHECLKGGLAPVMMQQTIALKSATTHQLCGANPWPYPPGAADAPGAEAPDTPQNSEVVVTND